MTHKIIKFLHHITVVIPLLFVVSPAYADNASVSQLISFENEFESLFSELSSSFDSGSTWKGQTKYISCLHSIKTKQWSACIKYLDQIKNTDPGYSSDLSHILYGISYHNNDETQQAFDHYRQIPSSSSYYIHAQLYIALLHVRYSRPQKANRLITRLLLTNSDRIAPEMKNKLHLIQGYLYFLSKDFLSSRNALQKVSVNSQYINDATASLALTHIYQGDYESAKKYLSYLSVKSVKDTPADTAYVLLAFAHSQENAFSESTMASYRNAIKYYKKRIAEIDSLMAGEIGLPIINSPSSSRLFIIENNMLDLSQTLPESFLSNYASLARVTLKTPASGKRDNLYKETARLHKHYERAIVTEARQQLLTRKNMLSRYLNQCMYTLARLLYQNKLQ